MDKPIQEDLDDICPKYRIAAPRYLENGYTPIPLRGKAPARDEWQNTSAEDVPGLIDGELGRTRNVGILCGKPGEDGYWVVGFDADILDPEAADEIHEIVEEGVGEAVPTRYGQRPKQLIPMRTNDPSLARKLCGETYVDAEGLKHHIEILARGQQFVAGGIHPDTKAPYRWEKGQKPYAGLSDVAAPDLPKLTKVIVDRALDCLAKHAAEKGWEKHSKGAPKGGGTDNLPAIRPQGVGLPVATQDYEFAELLESLKDFETTSKIPVSDLFHHAMVQDFDTYGEWIEGLVAPVAHEFRGGPEGLDFTIAVSSQKGNYQGPDDVGERYKRFSRSEFDGPVRTGASIIFNGNEAVLKGTFDRDHLASVVFVCAKLPQDKYLPVRNQVAAKITITGEALDEAIYKARAAEEKDHALHRMNTGLAVVLIDGQTRFAYMPEGRPVQFCAREDAANLFATLKVEVLDGHGVPKSRDAFEVWRKWPGRREYLGGVCFEPNGGRPDQLNMYQKNDILPVQGDASIFWDFVRDIICSGDLVVYRYVRRWMAYIYQNPGGQKQGVALIMHGGEGVGKGTFWEIYSRLFAPYIHHETNSDQLFDKHTTALANSILVFMDEAIAARDHKTIAQVKGLITESTVTVNPKFQKPYTVTNHCNFIIASNFKSVVHVGEGARRFCCLEVSDAQRQDRAYFGGLKRYMFEGGGLQTLAWDLLHEDVNGMLNERPPRTALLANQFEESASPEDRFLIHWLGREGEDSWETRTAKSAVFNQFKRYCEDNKVRAIFNEKSFGRLLTQRLQPKKGKTLGLERKEAYIFPSIDECRRRFNASVDMPIEWPEYLGVIQEVREKTQPANLEDDFSGSLLTYQERQALVESLL